MSRTYVRIRAARSTVERVASAVDDGVAAAVEQGVCTAVSRLPLRIGEDTPRSRTAAIARRLTMPTRMNVHSTTRVVT
jgi:hypothetical protein